MIVDDSVEQQDYVEDCAVCCRPIDISVTVAEDSTIQVSVSTDSEA